MLIGIDFGTCFSSVSIMHGDGVDNNLIIEKNPLGIPSQYLHQDGNDYFGTDCDIARNPSEIVKNMKKIVRISELGIEQPAMSNGQILEIGEIIKKFLTYLIERVEQSAELKKESIDDPEIEEITITAPNGTNSEMMSQRYNSFIKNTIMEITGLDENHVHVKGEPTAATIAYLYRNNLDKTYDEDMNVLAFDLGGGTLDTCIVEYSVKDGYTVKAKNGDLELGGNDWDDKFTSYMLKKMHLTLADADEKDEFNKSILKAKIDLSSKTVTKLVFEDSDYESHTEDVTRQEFEECTKELLDRAMVTLKKTIKSFNGGKINKVILVGGGSNMPQIKNRIYSELSEQIKEEDILIYEPSKAISCGAAINSKFENNSGLCEYGNERIRECSALTYGINLYPNKFSNEIKIKNMIFKGDEFYNGRITKRLDTYVYPSKDEFRFYMKFEIYESEISRNECNSEGFSTIGRGEKPSGMEIIIPIPEKYKGHARQFKVVPVLSVDTDGIVKVTIKDLEGNVIQHSEKDMKKEIVEYTAY